MALRYNRFVQTAAAAAIFLTSACGTKIDSGRNADPNRWPKDSTNPSDPENSRTRATGGSGCFTFQEATLAPAVKKFCDEQIVNQPALAKLSDILCSKRLLTVLLNKPECGWNGDSSKVMAYIYRYEIQPDQSKDFEDVVGSATHAPVSPERFILPLKLAFENYAEFKSRGYRWVDGTREMTNLSHGAFESGLDYRFRADKTQYEVGYQASVRLYQLTPDLFAHINVATGDFARINAFEQIAFYQRLPDQSTMTIRLEHRRVSSNGLYDLAKRSATEMSRDTMEKGFSNATKQ